MPKVSVIIPNYNHERYLRQRIQSVLNQTFTDFEVIILDDYSTDDSKKIIEQFRAEPRVTNIVYNATNSGSTFRQWEKGLRLAKGEWIWIAESDDYCEPTFLATLLKTAGEYERTGIAFCRSHWVDAAGVAGEELALFKENLCKKSAEAVKEMAIHCTVQNASSAIIKKEYALKAIKGLGKYRACGDWIFYTRILQHANLAHSAEQLNYFRWYHANISSKAKERLWMTEGVDVIKNINYGLVRFTRQEFLDTIRYWKWKTKDMSRRDRLSVWYTIFIAATRYTLHI